MSDYPQEPLFKKVVEAPDPAHDSVLVFVDKTGLIIVAAPYMGVPIFGPEMVDNIILALKEARSVSEMWRSGP